MGILPMLGFSQGEPAYWRIGGGSVDCDAGTVCFSVDVKMDSTDRQLSFVTLRYFHDTSLMVPIMGAGAFQNIENSYTVQFVQYTTPAIGGPLGFGTNPTGAGFSRISIAPNTANLLDIGGGTYQHVFDWCFDIVDPNIPAEFCAPIIYDINHTTLGQGPSADRGYLSNDAGVATQYYANGNSGTLLAADDEVEGYYNWTPDPGFDGILNSFSDTVGMPNMNDCITTGCDIAPDTIIVSIPPGTTDDACITAAELELGTDPDTTFLCETPSGVAAASPNAAPGDTCISITTNPTDYGLVDTLCVITCYEQPVDTLYDTTYIIVFVPPPPDTVIVTIPPETTDTVCVESQLQIGGDYDDVTICDDGANLTENEVASMGDTCVEITPNPGHYGLDTTCIIHCYDTLGFNVCDTTTIIVITPPPRDTITVPPGDTCLDDMTYELEEVDRAETCDPSYPNITVTLGTLDECVNVEPTDPDYSGVDTVCVILCDSISGIEVCDTTTIIVVTPPPPDTITVVVPPGTTDTVCVEPFLEFGENYANAMMCDDAPNVTDQTVTTEDGEICVEVIPDPNFTGLDTTCVIHCYDTADITVCDTTIIIVVVPPPPDTTFITIPQGETDTVCVSQFLELGDGFDNTLTPCNASSDATETVLPGDTCVELTVGPAKIGLDTTCIIHCYDTAGVTVCDTTTIIIITPPPTDTITVPPGDTCLDPMTYELPEVERVEVCGTDPNVTFTTGMDSCITVQPVDPDYSGVDTVCIILCDTINGIEICDTTTIIVVTPPPPDTVVVVIPPGETDTVCVEPELQFGGGYDSHMMCDDAANLTDAPVTNAMGDVCVEITPDQTFTGLDTTCIVHCYDTADITVCDTTIIIVVVPPPPDTTIVTIPPGETDTVCVEDLLELGDGYDRVEMCGDAPNATENIVEVNGDTCVEITPDPTHVGLDTTCVIHCYDTAGVEVCDTTIIIIVTPPPTDTITVPPGDTCLDPTTYELPEVERVEVCGTDPDVTFTTGMDSCITVQPTDPDYSGVDTVCIILCDTINGIEICDTTTIIVVTPPPPDTVVVVIPPGETDTVCVEPELQFGGGYDSHMMCDDAGKSDRRTSYQCNGRCMCRSNTR